MPVSDSLIIRMSIKGTLKVISTFEKLSKAAQTFTKIAAAATAIATTVAFVKLSKAILNQSKAWKDLRKDLGKMVSENPQVLGALKGIEEEFERLSKTVETNADAISEAVSKITIASVKGFSFIAEAAATSTLVIAEWGAKYLDTVGAVISILAKFSKVLLPLRGLESEFLLQAGRDAQRASEELRKSIEIGLPALNEFGNAMDRIVESMLEGAPAAKELKKELGAVALFAQLMGGLDFGDVAEFTAEQFKKFDDAERAHTAAVLAETERRTEARLAELEAHRAMIEERVRLEQAAQEASLAAFSATSDAVLGMFVNIADSSASTAQKIQSIIKIAQVATKAISTASAAAAGAAQAKQAAATASSVGSAAIVGAAWAAPAAAVNAATFGAGAAAALGVILGLISAVVGAVASLSVADDGIASLRNLAKVGRALDSGGTHRATMVTQDEIVATPEQFAAGIQAGRGGMVDDGSRSREVNINIFGVELSGFLEMIVNSDEFDTALTARGI